MIESTDILYYVLAFCALWITLVICWLIWRLAMLIRMLADTLALIRHEIEKIEQTIDYFKVKVDHSTSHLGGIARHIKDAVFGRFDR